MYVLPVTTASAERSFHLFVIRERCLRTTMSA